MYLLQLYGGIVSHNLAWYYAQFSQMHGTMFVQHSILHGTMYAWYYVAMEINHTTKGEHTMTKTIKSTKTGGHYIYMEYNFSSYPHIDVGACPMYKDGTCGYPVNQATYSTNEEDKAKRTYARYVRKFRDQ